MVLAAVEMKLHFRRAERGGAGTTNSCEKYANPIGPDSRDPSSVSQKRFTEMSIFLFHVRAVPIRILSSISDIFASRGQFYYFRRIL